MRFRSRQLLVAAVGGAWFAAALLVWTSGLFNLRENLRELAFDHELPLLAPRSLAQSPVIVVDIDSDSLARYGPWPWRRLIMAELLQKIAQAKPRVVGLDVLLTEPDRLSPAGLLRNLGAAADSDVGKLANKLPDGDAAIAAAVSSVSVVLGFVLDPGGAALPASAPILARGPIDVPDIWQAAGAIGSLPVIAKAARGFGAMVLGGDADGKVRRAPLLVVVGGQVRPGFPVELVRLYYDASSYIVETAPQRLRIGPLVAPIDADAAMRILPRPAASWSDRTISAWRILDDEASRKRLAGRIVLVGSGAPEVGGFRATPAAAASPSVQIHADAVETLTAGALPWRPSWVSLSEIFGAGALCLAAILLAIFRRPVTATILVVLMCLIWELIALGAFAWDRLLLDPAGPPFIAVVVFAATALANYAQNERLERALRLRFEQYLAPDIVKRLVDAPGMLRLDGERRDVTAMFTDIEGFTSLTERSEAGEVVRLLDNYLTIVTNIVIAHGGMVDALIGDGVFALFNAPLDLADHAHRAVAAAQAIIAATEDYRGTGLAAKLVLGRTRIGIESGMAIVGDVGGGGKLDYTARGNVVNTASRLEALNKELKTAICIGPLAAAKLGADELQRVGVMKIRGRSGELEVFTVASWRPSNDQSAAGASSRERPTAK